MSYANVHATSGLHPIFQDIVDNFRMSPSQRRTLTEIRGSLFAPRFPTLAEYGKPPEPAPTIEQVIEDATAALKWHATREIETAAEIDARRASTKPNETLIDDAARALAFHRAEQARISALIEQLTTDGE